MAEVACSDTDTEGGKAGLVDLVLDGQPRSISIARHAVARLLDPAEIPIEVVEDVMLLVSELVTNAVLHAGTVVRVSARAEPGRITVAVGDDDPHHGPRAPHLPDRESLAPGGRGIRLVQLLASSWGVEMHEKSKVVWFETAYRPESLDLRTAAP